VLKCETVGFRTKTVLHRKVT